MAGGKYGPVCTYTQAAKQVKQIAAYTLEHWGEQQVDRYLEQLYAVLRSTADQPEKGAVRYNRSKPFYMIRVESHFVLYQPFQNGVIIAGIYHARSDMEGLIRKHGAALNREIEELLKNVDY